MENSRAYGRGLLRGIARYARINGAWTVTHEERSLDEGIPSWFYASKFDGVILRSDSADALQRVIETGIPVVDLRAAFDSAAYVVETDDRIVTRMAVDHLRERGHRRFAYCGFADPLAVFSKRRLQFMKDCLGDAREDLAVFEVAEITRSDSTSMIESVGHSPEPDLVAWLKSLAKPVAILACNDVRGSQVLRSCLENDISVPDEVAVIGVDNDETICELAQPAMSSVANNTQLIGYRAAETLHQLMKSIEGISKIQLIEPNGVVARLSTDATIVADPSVAEALRFIRDHACEGIQVSDVVKCMTVSRATAERRFRKSTERSIGDEIRRVRLDKVRQLLTATDMKLASIATMAGFGHAEYMTTTFKAEFGVTPSQYRRDHQWK